MHSRGEPLILFSQCAVQTLSAALNDPGDIVAKIQRLRSPGLLHGTISLEHSLLGDSQDRAYRLAVRKSSAVQHCQGSARVASCRLNRMRWWPEPRALAHCRNPSLTSGRRNCCPCSTIQVKLLVIHIQVAAKRLLCCSGTPFADAGPASRQRHPSEFPCNATKPIHGRGFHPVVGDECV